MHPNGCYHGSKGEVDCLAMACSIDNEKHTFSQSCSMGNIPFPDPEDFPKCPPGWEIASANSKEDTACPNDICAGSGGGGSQPSTTGLPLTTVDTTNGELCVPVPTAPTTVATYPTAEYSGPFVHIGSDGCPEGFILEHNNGSLFFECSYDEICVNHMACNNFGDCTGGTTCYTAEEKCQAEMTSVDDPTDLIGACAYWGCSLRKFFKYYYFSILTIFLNGRLWFN